MIRVEKTHLPVAALTHPGMKGKNNEDRFGVSAFRLKGPPEKPILLAVLSDGIGGNRAGEIAAELAVNVISQYVAQSDGRSPIIILEEAIHAASKQIYLQAQTHGEQTGMGATCACAWVVGDQLYTATVGDSRIYLMRQGSIQQLSIDHTWIQEALEHGIIQPDEVAGHPNAHVIRRYLGAPTPPDVDFRLQFGEKTGEAAFANQGTRLLPDDCVLVCSDGLTDLVSDEEILDAFTQYDLEQAGHALIDLANERGGHDNITLMAMQMPSPDAVPVPTARPARIRTLLTGCLAVILLAVLVGVVWGGLALYNGTGRPTDTPAVTVTATIARTLPTSDNQPTRLPSITPSPFGPPTETRMPPTLTPGNGLTLTPWPTNTAALPVVTVAP